MLWQTRKLFTVQEIFEKTMEIVLKKADSCFASALRILATINRMSERKEYCKWSCFAFPAKKPFQLKNYCNGKDNFQTHTAPNWMFTQKNTRATTPRRIWKQLAHIQQAILKYVINGDFVLYLPQAGLYQLWAFHAVDSLKLVQNTEDRDLSCTLRFHPANVKMSPS